MTTDSNTTLPRWGGITEPMTVLTNVVLAGVAFVLGIRLSYNAAAEAVGSAGALGLGFLATAFAATLGAAAHGLGASIRSAVASTASRASAGSSTAASPASLRISLTR